MAQCTSLDHIYPKKKFGTPCACGQRIWGKRYTADSPIVSKSQAKRLAAQSRQEVSAPADNLTEKIDVPVEKVLASDSAADVGSSQNSETVHVPVSTTNESGEKTMTATLTFKGLSKSGKYALYSGLRTVTRLAITNFPDSKPVPSFTAEGEFAGPREKLTPEQRKAARAAKPKLTLAERIEKQRAALAKAEAKLAKQAEAEPVGATA